MTEISSGPEITQDERTMALLAHVLQLVGWFIAPLIIFVTKRESRFVSFHALQALLLQALYMAASAVSMVAWFMIFLLSIPHPPHSTNSSPPVAVFVFPLIWLGFMAAWVVMLVVAIVYGIKAARGEWVEYPVLGKIARKILKLRPGGV